MLKTSSMALALLIGAGMAPGAASADGDPARGKQLSATCMGCHGVESYFNTYPTYHVPRLGGQSAKYIESALKAYKNGERGHNTMHANAANLSEQDMADIGAYMESKGK